MSDVPFPRTINPRPDWSYLPPELLVTIFSFLSSNTDCISFRSVCPSWRSASPRRLPFPFLLYPPPSRLYVDGHHLRDFIDLGGFWQGTVDLPNLRVKHICGATDGWLVLRGISSRPPLPISVFNPLTQIEISLPPLEKFALPPEKIVLAPFDAVPSAAVAIMGPDQPLLFFSRAHSLWRPLQKSSSFHDAVCVNRALYAVDATNKIYVYDPIAPETVPIEVPVLENHRRGKYRREKNYLVESSGDLFLVIRGFSHARRRVKIGTDQFKVFKLDLSEKPECRAREVRRLGDDRVFFVGVNTSFSFSAAINKRCNYDLYFSDDGFSRSWETDDCGFLSLDEGNVLHFRRHPVISRVNPVVPPAIFFVPSA